ncbi:MAG TPA: RDD family protein [Blastocatellia bacterium]|nr:RDD family protein [Blastocatellia bacterium]
MTPSYSPGVPPPPPAGYSPSYPPPPQPYYQGSSWQQPGPSYPPQQPPQQYYQGSGWQQPGPQYPGQQYMAAMGPQFSPSAAGRPVGAFMRWLAYFLDVLPMGFIHLIGMIPIVGNIVGGALGVLYMLFRDAMGASVGKQLLGSAIITSNGMVPSRKELVMRNVPLAIPYIFLMIPLVGPIICLIIGIPVFLTEHILALTTGLRIGDRLAGTRVVERAPRG